MFTKKLSGLLMYHIKNKTKNQNKIKNFKTITGYK